MFAVIADQGAADHGGLPFVLEIDLRDRYVELTVKPSYQGFNLTSFFF